MLNVYGQHLLGHLPTALADRPAVLVRGGIFQLRRSGSKELGHRSFSGIPSNIECEFMIASVRAKGHKLLE
jgi:hypothetical protein